MFTFQNSKSSKRNLIKSVCWAQLTQAENICTYKLYTFIYTYV